MLQSPLDVPTANWRDDEEISMFSDAVGQFFEKECQPHVQDWRKAGVVPREVWSKAGEMGLLCASMPEEYGGAGGDFRHEAVIIEQQQWKGIDGFGITLHNAIVAPYIQHYGSEEQKQKWLPKLATGELVCAIAMT
ncbi:MAG: acyl-CoA dehydrogenase family protein, partial [Pseudomonadota bacterium]